jgi:hypothetical protein
VEWTQTPKNPPFALQFDAAPNQLHQIRAPGNFLKQLLAKQHLPS